MRKRLGAIHSDSTEEYEKLAIETNNKSLIFYNSKNHSSKKINEKILSSFDYCYDYVESSMDTCESAQNLSDITFRTNNVMIIDSKVSNVRPEVLRYCSVETIIDQNYTLDFAAKAGLQDKTFRFWIYNIQNSQFETIIDEYIRSSETFVFFYHVYLKQQYKEFLMRIKQLKPQDTITIYKVRIDSDQSILAYKSFKTVFDSLHIQKILCSSIQDALELLQ